jgi:hypothetical protein
MPGNVRGGGSATTMTKATAGPIRLRSGQALRLRGLRRFAQDDMVLMVR